MKHKILFIDWDGTLSNSRFWERWSLSSENIPKYELIQKVLFHDAQNLLHDWMCGWVPMVTVVEYVSRSTGIPYEELLDELRYSCENMKFIDVDVIDHVQKIRQKGMKVLIATDNMDTFRHWTMPALKINDYFDGTLISDTRGALKVQSHADGTSMFFNHFFTQNNIKPQESVLIDNSLNNKSVEKFGMNFLHVNEETPLTKHLSRFAYVE